MPRDGGDEEEPAADCWGGGGEATKEMEKAQVRKGCASRRGIYIQVRRVLLMAEWKGGRV